MTGSSRVTDSESAKSKASPFRSAFTEWKSACAALCTYETDLADKADINDEEHERQLVAAMKAKDDAEWNLLRTPAHGILEIRWRALAVQEMFTEATWNGEPTDNRHYLMLNALVSEILSPIAEE
jgi:hypothetical protein